MKLSEAWDKYLLHCTEKGHSQKTLTGYKDICLPFIATIGGDKDIMNITMDDVAAYLSRFQKSGLARASISSYSRTIKCFLNYLKKYFDIPLKTSLIPVPKCRPRIVNILTIDDLSELAEAIKTESLWLTLRNKTIILMMLDSGLRQNEVATLRRDCIYKDSTMKVIGKGNKERIVPLGRTTQQFLNEYLRQCPYESDYVFIERRGERLSANAIKLFMSRLNKRLPFDVSSHKLRHNFATNYCLDQYQKFGYMDAYRLKAIMGHNELTTTLGYIHEAEGIIASRESISHMDNVISKCSGWTL